VHWDGVAWEMVPVPIPFINSSGEVIGHYPYELQSVYAFSTSDVWFLAGARVLVQWDGNSFNDRYDFDNPYEDAGNTSKLWGITDHNIYLIGNTGTIVHYEGSSFTKMESGTETPLRDIWGLDENHIWISSWTLATYEQESVILEYDNQSFERKYVSSGFYPVLSDSISGYMYSVWSFEDTLYISCEGGLWKESLSTGVGYLTNRSTVAGKQVYIGKVRGNGYNDVFWLFSWGELYHYNGKTWKNILDLALQYPDVPLGAWGFAVRENMVVFVGNIHGDDQALIVRGQR
jgi:hypothetical protein